MIYCAVCTSIHEPKQIGGGNSNGPEKKTQHTIAIFICDLYVFINFDCIFKQQRIIAPADYAEEETSPKIVCGAEDIK